MPNHLIAGLKARAPDPDRRAIVGRAKDLVITGGHNVHLKEVEESIDALPRNAMGKVQKAALRTHFRP